jgi:hypothetical protein
MKINQASIFINTAFSPMPEGVPYNQLRSCCCVPMFGLELYVLEIISSRPTYTKRKYVIGSAVVQGTVISSPVPFS